MISFVTRALRISLLAMPLLATCAVAQTVPASPVAPDAGSPLLPASSDPSRLLADCTDPTVVTQGTANLLLANDNTQELGQSFTAACTGKLDRLQLVYQPAAGSAGTTVTGTITVFAGTGTTGTVLTTTPFSRVILAEGAAYALDTSFDNLSVAEGQVYTVFVDMTAGSILLQTFNQNAPGGPFADAYTGGTLFGSTTGGPSGATAAPPFDLRFSVRFVPTGPTAADAGPAAGHLGPLTPNPTTGTSRLALTADAAQTVRVAVVDTQGREVSVVFEGPVTAGVETPISVDTAGLPAGVYVVRVVGATFAEARRLTVVR